MELTTLQLADFRDKGFIVLKGFFDRSAVGAMSDTLDDLRSRPLGEVMEARYYERSSVTGQGILVRIEDFMGSHNPDLTRALLSPETMGCLTQLFGAPPILFKDKINYKPPGCRADKLHQDQAAGLNAFADFFISMGIVVDQNRRDNAALSFLNTGSYRRALMSPEWHPLSDADPPYTPREDYVLLESDPGDVIFFDSYVPHGSPPNTSNRARRNIFLTFNRRSQGDMRSAYYQQKWARYPPNEKRHARLEESYLV